MSSQSGNQLNVLFNSALSSGTLSAQSASLLTGHMGSVVVAGAAGKAAEDIEASDVTLVTVLIDASSSIASSKLEQAVRDGHNLLVDTFSKSKEKDSILMAVWTFNDRQKVLHSYIPVEDAIHLDNGNYSGCGSTNLYDTWCDALGANVAYAQHLRDSGTPCRSIVVVITDGEDCGSRRKATDCAKLSQDLIKSELFILAFIGVGVSADFRRVARSMGIPDRNIDVQRDATPSGLRQTFQMVSQSAIRASQARIQPGSPYGFFHP